MTSKIAGSSSSSSDGSSEVNILESATTACTRIADSLSRTRSIKADRSFS